MMPAFSLQATKAKSKTTTGITNSKKLFEIYFAIV